MISNEQMMSLAKIHSRVHQRDPAVSCEDIYQEILLELFKRKPEHFGFGWIISRQVAVRFIRRQHRAVEHFGTLDVGFLERPLASWIEIQELREKIRNQASPTQARVLLSILDGNTPNETSRALGMSLGSISQSITLGVRVLRKIYGVPDAGEIRLGRCRETGPVATPVISCERECIECGNRFFAKRVDARICSNKCRCRRSFKLKRQVAA
jgi:DNA-directed RNA polymerase specialized sigma24 family protein